MPRGPFAPVEQEPIRDTRLVAEKLPASAAEVGGGIFDAVAKGADALAQIQRTRFEDQIKDDLSSELDATELGLAAVRDPTVQQNIFDAAANGNPFFQRAKEEFLSIADAVKQGKLPSDAARIRTKAALAAAINETPEFEDELRSHAKAALGFSPEAAVFRDLLREPKAGPKTAAQKQEEAIQAGEAIGIPRDVMIAGMRNTQLAEFEQAQINLQLSRGELGANQAAAAADAQAGIMMTDLMASVQANMTQNGGVYDAATVMASANQLILAQRAAALNSLPPEAGVDVRNRVSNQFNDHARAIRAMIEDGSMERMMTQENATIQAMIVNNMMNVPELATIHTLGGKDDMLEYVTLLSKYKTPKQLEVVQSVHPSLAGLTTLQQFAAASGEAVRRQAENLPAQSDQERVLRSIYNGQIIRSQESTPDRKNEAITRMRADIGDLSTLKQFNDGAVLAATKRDAEMSDTFANLFSQQVAATKQVLAEMTAAGVELEISGEGLNKRITRNVLNVPTGLDAPRMIDALNTANLLIEMGNRYEGAGIIKWEGAQQFFDEATQVAAPEGMTDITQEALDAGFKPPKDGVYANADGTTVTVRDGRVFRSN